MRIKKKVVLLYFMVNCLGLCNVFLSEFLSHCIKWNMLRKLEALSIFFAFLSNVSLSLPLPHQFFGFLTVSIVFHLKKKENNTNYDNYQGIKKAKPLDLKQKQDNSKSHQIKAKTKANLLDLKQMETTLKSIKFRKKLKPTPYI